MVMLLRSISGLRPHIRLFASCGIQQRWISCFPSSYRMNKIVLLSFKPSQLCSRASPCYFNSGQPYLTHVQENKRAESLGNIPKLKVDAFKVETAVPTVQKGTSLDSSAQPPIKQPDENNDGKQTSIQIYWVKIRNWVVSFPSRARSVVKHYYHGCKLFFLKSESPQGFYSEFYEVTH
ncbi:unnamed protein product [Heterobilharzia americana]|nr:unnamed protein product [Heterobilharzia americana]